MNADKLIRMANQIASFFDADPDRAAALDGIASHLSRFWDPRMRRELLAAIDAGAAEGLRESVLEAVATHRARVEPRG